MTLSSAFGREKSIYRADRANEENSMIQENLVKIATSQIPGMSVVDMGRMKMLIESRFPGVKRRLQGEAVTESRANPKRRATPATSINTMARAL